MERAEVEHKMYASLQQLVGYLMAVTVVDWSLETGKISDREHKRLSNMLNQRHNVCAEA